MEDKPRKHRKRKPTHVLVERKQGRDATYRDICHITQHPKGQWGHRLDWTFKQVWPSAKAEASL